MDGRTPYDGPSRGIDLFDYDEIAKIASLTNEVALSSVAELLMHAETKPTLSFTLIIIKEGCRVLVSMKTMESSLRERFFNIPNDDDDWMCALVSLRRLETH